MTGRSSGKCIRCDVDTHSLMQSGICNWSTGTNSASSCKLWMKRIFLLNFSLQAREKRFRLRGFDINTKRLIMIIWHLVLLAERMIIRAHLMNGLMTVITALTYQAGWTTKSPFKSFLNLQRKRKYMLDLTLKSKGKYFVSPHKTILFPTSALVLPLEELVKFPGFMRNMRTQRSKRWASPGPVWNHERQAVNSWDTGRNLETTICYSTGLLAQKNHPQIEPVPLLFLCYLSVRTCKTLFWILQNTLF